MDLQLNTTLSHGLAYLEQCDRRACAALNRLSRHKPLHALFSTASRLGDGVVWYSLMALMALMQGEYGVRAASVMAFTGLTGLGLYKLMKTRLMRERPFVSDTDILLGGQPLDRHSFPSGHTLHAVAFTIIAVAWFPGLAGVLVPLALLIGASRVVLGLHYPSDVVIGALIGWSLAEIALLAIPPGL